MNQAFVTIALPRLGLPLCESRGWPGLGSGTSLCSFRVHVFLVRIRLLRQVGASVTGLFSQLPRSRLQPVVVHHDPHSLCLRCVVYGVLVLQSICNAAVVLGLPNSVWLKPWDTVCRSQSSLLYRTERNQVLPPRGEDGGGKLFVTAADQPAPPLRPQSATRPDETAGRRSDASSSSSNP